LDGKKNSYKLMMGSSWLVIGKGGGEGLLQKRREGKEKIDREEAILKQRR